MAKISNKRPTQPVRRYEDILYEVKDQVAWITINRPRVMNAFRELEHYALALAGCYHVDDVALEACRIRLNLLKQQSLAGITERAARFPVLLEHRDCIAAGNQR